MRRKSVLRWERRRCEGELEDVSEWEDDEGVEVGTGKLDVKCDVLK
jgi:hypothetical protein